MRRAILLAGLLAPAAAAALEPGQPSRAHSVGAELRLGLLRGEPRDVAPDAGFGFGVNAQWFYLPRLGLRADATYDRFGSWRDTRDQIAYFGFGVLPLVGAYPLGRWLPWAGVGGGVAVGWFRSDDDAFEQPGPCEFDDERMATMCPAAERAALPFARAALGVGYEAAPRLSVGLRGEYTLVLGGDTVPMADGARARDVRVFDDTIQIAVAGDYYF